MLELSQTVTLVDAIAPASCGAVAQPPFETARGPARVTWIAARSKSTVGDLLPPAGLVPDWHLPEQACRHGLGVLRRSPQSEASGPLAG